MRLDVSTYLKTSMTFKRASYLLLIGVVSLVLAVVLSQLVNETAGHTVDVTKLPNEAKAVLQENPGVRLSQEQVSRLTKIRQRNGWHPNFGDFFFSSAKAGWYWFLLVPVAISALIAGLKKDLRFFEFLLIALPSIVILLVAIFGGFDIS